MLCTASRFIVRRLPVNSANRAVTISRKTSKRYTNSKIQFPHPFPSKWLFGKVLFPLPKPITDLRQACHRLLSTESLAILLEVYSDVFGRPLSQKDIVALESSRPIEYIAGPESYEHNLVELLSWENFLNFLPWVNAQYVSDFKASWIRVWMPCWL